MRHGSLFSGIGGFDLAAEWMGWENVFHCEIAEFPRKVLKYHFPNAVSLEDITKTQFKRDERGDVYVRRVTADTENSRAGENIGGIRQGACGIDGGPGANTEFETNEEETQWLNIGPVDILTGGFPCQPFSLAGKRKGTEDSRHLWPEMLRTIRQIKPTWVVGENVFGIVNLDGGVVFEQVQADLEAEGYEVQPYVLPACAVNAPHRRDRVWFVAHATSIRRPGQDNDNRGVQQKRISGTSLQLGKFGTSPDPGLLGQAERQLGTMGSDQLCKERDAADTECNGIQGHEQQTRVIGEVRQGREGATEIGNKRSIGTWDSFPTQPTVRGRNDGLSYGLDGITFSKWRNESIKAYGNAIVPQVAFQIFKAIQQYENL